MKTKKLILIVLVTMVIVFTNCTKKPIACVDSASKSGIAGQAISFDGSCSENAHHYQWDFGDGGSAHSASASHVYNNSGTYTAKLKAVSKNSKKEDEKTVTVTVN